MKLRKKIAIALIVIVLLGLLCACGKKENKETPVQGNVEIYNVGDTFTFDGFEFCIQQDIEFQKTEEPFKGSDKAIVIILPVTIENKSDTARGFNMFLYKIYGPKQEEVDNLSSLFMLEEKKPAIDFIGPINAKEKKQCYFYLLYKEDGDYLIQFKNEQKEVKITVSISLKSE